MRYSRERNPNILMIVFFLLLTIFIIDLQTPVGIANGVLYLIVLFPFIWAFDRRYLTITVIVVLILIIAGYFLSPPAMSDAGANMAIINRLFSIILVIVSAVIIIRYKKSELIYRNNFQELLDFKHALDESSIIAITDQKGIIKKVNGNFCKISKYTEKELIGKDHRIINSGYHEKEFIRDLWLTIANGKIWKGELKNKAKDGTIYWVDTTIVPFLNEQGKPYQYLAIRSDITLRKKVEEIIIQQNDELEKFIHISSHDLQEPVRKIQIFTKLLLTKENQNLSDDGKYYFSRLHGSAKQMQILLQDLVVYFHYKASTHKFEKTDLNVIIEEIKSELKDFIQEKNATIEAVELCPVNIIPFLFHQLMFQLISNAFKFSQPDIPPHIIIKCRMIKYNELNNEKLSNRKDYCHISVEDNGIGFEPHQKDRIFEIFQRLNGKEEYEGTGIGLAIVKKIVESHNGIITANSKVKKGSKFDIYIPAD